MTKREAVIKAINHEYVTPVPYVLSMTTEVRRRMEKLTGNPNFAAEAGSYLTQADCSEFEQAGGDMLRDRFGVVWDRLPGEDIGRVAYFPISGEGFGDYVFPEVNEREVRARCEALEKKNDLFRVFEVSFSLFERAWTLHSMEQTLMDFVLAPDFMHELFDRIVEYNLGVVNIVREYDIDAVYFGDDWGQQQGLIMGYPHWSTSIKPRLKRMYSAVKAAGMYTCQHSCGDCREIFPDLTEIGLDIYNTFQPEVYDIVEFKQRFGDKITFYGGISTQRVLPFCKPDELKAEMHRIIDVLSADGGYIIAPTHAMPPDIPEANVLAFLEVCQNENPRYPHPPTSIPATSVMLPAPIV